MIYIENDRAAQQQEVISLVAAGGYRAYWHAPKLFDPANFKGVRENVFGGLASLSMLCIPNERSTQVQGLQAIDPSNWACPIPAGR